MEYENLRFLTLNFIISLNKSNTLFHIMIDYKYNSEFRNGFEFVDIRIE